jgi:hypothetical protein
MLKSGLVFLLDNALPHTAAHTQALLEHFHWELFDHLSYSSDLAPVDYHLFTYLKNWLRSQYFSSNEELMEGVTAWLRSQVANFLTQAYKILFPDMTSALIPAATTLGSSLSMYLFFVYNIFFFSASFINSSPVVTFRIAVV